MSAFEALRKMIHIAKELDNIALNAEILELQSCLNDLIDENYKLKEEIRALKGQKLIQPSAPVKPNDKNDVKHQDDQELPPYESNESGSLLDF